MISGIVSKVYINNINVDMKLTILEPLHAALIIQLCNHMTLAEGRAVFVNGW